MSTRLDDPWHDREAGVRDAPGAPATLDTTRIDDVRIGAVRALGVTEVHASCSAPAETPPERIAVFGFASPSARRTDPAKVASLRKALDA